MRVEVRRYAFGSMGCPCELHLEADAATADAAARAARAEVDRLDAKYSHYRDDSLLGQLAARAGSGEWTALDRESADLFAFADELHRQSEGRFDPSAAPLTRLWSGERVRLPDDEEIQAALRLIGWSAIEREDARVRLPRAGMALDFGGVVKEYGADRAAAACRAHGVAAGLVDLGGDIAVVGPHRDGGAWRIGIKDPRAPARAIATIALARGGLATSGDYERGVCVDGVRHSHIVDPRNGRPVASFASVSVAAPDCMVAGASATLALLLGELQGARWLSSLGVAHLCIAHDGEMRGPLPRV